MTLSASADELSYAEHVRISDDTQVHVAKLILKTCFLHGRVPSPLFAVGGEIIFCVCVCVCFAVTGFSNGKMFFLQTFHRPTKISNRTSLLVPQ